jgi:hypothetical protein
MSDESTRDAPSVASEPPPRRARCLSDGQLQALQSQPPGQIPSDVAAHLASCERCQRLALFGPPETGRRARKPPSLRRAFLLVGIVLAALVVFLLSLRMLTG